jgi:hypothetical protein
MCSFGTKEECWSYGTKAEINVFSVGYLSLMSIY